jgi:hypothetical protein
MAFAAYGFGIVSAEKMWALRVSQKRTDHPSWSIRSLHGFPSGQAGQEFFMVSQAYLG